MHGVGFLRFGDFEDPFLAQKGVENWRCRRCVLGRELLVGVFWASREDEDAVSRSLEEMIAIHGASVSFH